MAEDRIAADEWLVRCAKRVIELDPAIDAVEARRIAAEMRQVERLAAMAPEAAVDFVQRQLASERPDRYERRGTAR